MHLAKAFLRDESGATAVEYGLIVSGIAIAIFLAISTLGGAISTTLGTLTTALKNN